MLVFFLICVILLLATLLGISGYFLLKFSKIIMVFEDDASEAIDTLNNVEDTIKNVLNMQIFFDSPDVRKEVEKILEDVKICRLSIGEIISRFTARSKQQYYFVEFDEEVPLLHHRPIPRLPGQPPDTPNPLEILQNEGMILDVRHKREQ